MIKHCIAIGALWALSTFAALAAAPLQSFEPFAATNFVPDAQQHRIPWTNSTSQPLYITRIKWFVYNNCMLPGSGVAGATGALNAGILTSSNQIIDWVSLYVVQGQVNGGNGQGISGDERNTVFSPDYFEIDPGDTITLSYKATGFMVNMPLAYSIVLWYTTTAP
jgi:hypothetical protein